MIHENCQQCGTRNETGSQICAACGASTVVSRVAIPDAEPEPDYHSFEHIESGPSRISYDPKIIGIYANALYRRADWIVFVWSIIGAVFGAAICGFYGGQTGLLLGIVVGGIMGYSEGQSRSFFLRLQAQLALCQVQIEANTRSS